MQWLLFVCHMVTLNVYIYRQYVYMIIKYKFICSSFRNKEKSEPLTAGKILHCQKTQNKLSKKRRNKHLNRYWWCPLCLYCCCFLPLLNMNQELLYLCQSPYTMKVLFFMGINFHGLVKNYKIVDFGVCTQNKICLFYIFNIISFIG
jgi:hypothetical protein